MIRLSSWIALLSIVFLMAPSGVSAQIMTSSPKQTYEIPDPAPFAAGINAADLKILLDSLASTTMAGRETGQEGQRLAAAYIAAQFAEAGIKPASERKSYFQDIHFQSIKWADLVLKVGNTEFSNRKEYFVMPAFNASNPMIKLKEVVFVGYGIEEGLYNDYADVDVRGKAVVFYMGEPLMADGTSLITKTKNRSNWSVDWRKKVELAAKNGAIAAIIVEPRFEESLKKNRKDISTYGWKMAGDVGPDLSKGLINSIFVNQTVADAIFGKKADKIKETLVPADLNTRIKGQKLKSEIEIHLAKESEALDGSNVIGIIEGSDSILKNEYIFITAHYDHLGQSDESVIYFGADDNASGTSGVIEIARAFAEAKKQGKGPRRSVVFMLVSGEEKGLLGSKYYTESPVFPLKNTVVDINIDMIGRVDKEHTEKPDYVYVIGADRMSNDLKGINEYVNNKYTKLELDYKYDAPDDTNHYYERSDHYNFAQKGVPAIFFFNGTHDDYHKPTDTADKINFDAQAKRAQLAFYLAWNIANRPDRISRK